MALGVPSKIPLNRGRIVGEGLGARLKRAGRLVQRVTAFFETSIGSIICFGNTVQNGSLREAPQGAVIPAISTRRNPRCDGAHDVGRVQCP